MKLSKLTKQVFSEIDWDEYDLIFLACGFEERSCHIVSLIPTSAIGKCKVLGFPTDLNTLSRSKNDGIFTKLGLIPFVSTNMQAYEAFITQSLVGATQAANNSPLRILIDYSVMTRSWYGHLLNWLKYSTESVTSHVDFVYVHGRYQSDFEPLHISEISAISGFEGSCAGTRSTVAFFGLGYDRYATLSVYELIAPDLVTCYIAQDSPYDEKAKIVFEQNKEIIDISGSKPIYLPLGNIQEVFRILHESFAQIPSEYEVIAIPMGPKPHVLATLMVAQFLERVTCLHAKGTRMNPVEVTASGETSVWRGEYR